MPSIDPVPTPDSIRDWATLRQILQAHKEALDELHLKVNHYQHFHVLTHTNIGNLHERFRVTLQTLHRLSLANDKNTAAYELQIKEVLEQMQNCEARINSMIATQEKILDKLEEAERKQ